MNIVVRFAAAALFSLPALVSAAVAAEGVPEAVAPKSGAPKTIDFARDIRPILSDNCFKCHGPDSGQRKADLRLDTPEGLLAEIDGHAPFVPGKPEASEALRRVASHDPDEQMPPPDSGRKPLSSEQIELLRAWVAQGAVWRVHWALVAPKASPLPAVEQAQWPRNPIDHFILARLEREGLKPSTEASKETLARRVTLDLTGLPPTPAEVDAFLADTSADAYERLVDRLLASPRYGERMAIEWLDAARYADTNGYQGDGVRTLWPWRDWVVDALNNNMPFDQFTIQQIAGDLLPGATQSQKLATGFHRNHMLNGEGGRIAEESRVEYVFDRVDTTATVWLGLTLACARCHDHKYDPFSQREFYQLYAYFNSIDESGAVDRGGNAAPVMALPTPEQSKQVDELNAKVAGLATELSNVEARLLAAQPAWEQHQRSLLDSKQAPPDWTVLRPLTMTSARGATLALLDDQSVLVSGENPVTDIFTLTAATDLAGITGLRLEALMHPSMTQGRLARSDSGNFVLTELEVEFASVGGEPKRAGFRSATAEYEQGGFPVSAAFDGKPNTGWAVYNPPDMQHDRRAVFVFDQPIAAGPGTQITVRLKHESVHRHHNLGRFRISLSSAPEPKLGPLGPPEAFTVALGIETAQRTPEQAKQVSDHYLMSAAERIQAASALEAGRKSLAELEKTFPQTMVMQELAKRRDTAILIRGAYDKPGDKVISGVPAALPPLPDAAPRDRLGLARWLVDPANPLSSRVAVNRQWQMFFGTGLVKTAEDFGSQGELPSHGELLDWLAVEFQRAWNVKALQRLIVTSATYRQSSHVTAALLERDPENRLLARAPRFRWSAHVLHDQALAASGLLIEKRGGPPVKPYQPAGVWEDMSFGQIRYEQDHGEKLYRRSLYTFWRRTVGPTNIFDTSARQVCSVRPRRTNTPLQSLVLLNDTRYVEAARVLAERLLHEAPAPADRIVLAYRLLTARRPTATELDLVSATLERAKSQFAQDPAAALKLIAVGESPRDPKLDAGELAAHTVVCSLLLNLDEVINKE